MPNKIKSIEQPYVAAKPMPKGVHSAYLQEKMGRRLCKKAKLSKAAQSKIRARLVQRIKEKLQRPACHNFKQTAYFEGLLLKKRSADTYW